jgi:hypothetical protein
MADSYLTRKNALIYGMLAKFEGLFTTENLPQISAMRDFTNLC